MEELLVSFNVGNEGTLFGIEVEGDDNDKEVLLKLFVELRDNGWEGGGGGACGSAVSYHI